MPFLTQGTLAFKRKSRGQRVNIPEKQVEADTDFELSRFNFPFLNTTVRYKFETVKCPHCEKFHKWRPTGGTGQDKGIADRLVYSPKWWHPLLPATLWLSVELKGSKTRFSSDEQEQLATDGHTVVARSGAASLEAARQVTRFFDYVERLEQDGLALLDQLRVKGSDWKSAARKFQQTLHEAGETELLATLSPQT